MQLAHLVDHLSAPSAYPLAVETVQVRQTHISIVFLAGPFVWKIKKPVDLGFLDYSTLQKRRQFCEQEVQLNRRLAPDVYLGVVPVTRLGDGLKFEGDGEVVEWAVKMRRLPETATLRAAVERGKVQQEQVEELARRLAAFHAASQSGPSISAFGRFAVVAGNARENFEQAERHVGRTVSRTVFERVRTLTETALEELKPLIEQRAKRGVPRDTHGDLRLEHIYLFPDQPPPNDVVVIDCIEFNERFRAADPVADLAFVCMDLHFHHRPDLANTLAEAWFRAADDAEGRNLLSFYTAYRSVVRGKVEGFKLDEDEIHSEQKARALIRARAHWLLALSVLEQPERKPCLLLVGGLPGVGKSTLARRLADAVDFKVIRSDEVRKQLAATEGVGVLADLYTSAWNDRTYAECLRRATELLFEGRRVIVDASFREEERRRLFLDAARRLGVPARFLLCQADADVVRRRLAARRDDASDADWNVYKWASEHWEDAGETTRDVLRILRTDDTLESAVEQARTALP